MRTSYFVVENIWTSLLRTEYYRNNKSWMQRKSFQRHAIHDLFSTAGIHSPDLCHAQASNGTNAATSAVYNSTELLGRRRFTR